MNRGIGVTAIQPTERDFLVEIELVLNVIHCYLYNVESRH